MSYAVSLCHVVLHELDCGAMCRHTGFGICNCLGVLQGGCLCGQNPSTLPGLAGIRQCPELQHLEEEPRGMLPVCCWLTCQLLHSCPSLTNDGLRRHMQQCKTMHEVFSHNMLDIWACQPNNVVFESKSCKSCGCRPPAHNIT